LKQVEDDLKLELESRSRKALRVAWDGQAYSYEDFEQWYGSAARECWDQAQFAGSSPKITASTSTQTKRRTRSASSQTAQDAELPLATGVQSSRPLQFAVASTSKEMFQEPWEEKKLSDAQACALETANLAEAIMRSKAEVPLLPPEAAVIYRLTTLNSEVSALLMEVEELSQARARVVDAGCEVRPSFGGGATFFIPITEQQYAELGHPLLAHHVVALQEDKPAIEKALSCLSKPRRPKVKDAVLDYLTNQPKYAGGQVIPPSSVNAPSDIPCMIAVVSEPEALEDSATAIIELHEERCIGIVIATVKHTFVNFYEPCSHAQSDDAWHSAPF